MGTIFLVSLGVAYQSAMRERVRGQAWGSAMSEAGFLHERHLLMLPFKWTVKSMNIIGQAKRAPHWGTIEISRDIYIYILYFIFLQSYYNRISRCV